MNILNLFNTYSLFKELKKDNPYKIYTLNDVVDFLRIRNGYEVYKHGTWELNFPDNKQFLRLKLQYSHIFQ